MQLDHLLIPFIFPQLNAPKWQMPNLEYDGLTTNGITFMRPTGTYESGVAPGKWRKVTVMGNVCKLRAKRSSKIPGSLVSLKCIVKVV